jgi:ABC-type bacteriocin/lantibiotic exporter with double-glycine peptidase domain
LTAGARPRRWLAPEVVQTSSMDCGPAALKCLLEGFHIPVSYGRLREACQTSVDGTSIDTIEVVAGQLGLDAEQVLIPVDHVTLDDAGVAPAIVVVRHADTATHFVVVWRRVGPWLQVMDPAQGRRWVLARRFGADIFRHTLSVAAPQWRAWTASPAFLAPFRARMLAIGIRPPAADSLIAEVLSDPAWFPIAALDAAVRLVQSVATAGGVERGEEAAKVAATLFRATRDSADDIFNLVPAAYWSATPDAGNRDPSVEMLKVSGAVLLRIGGVTAGAPDETVPLSVELTGALAERPSSPLRNLWRMLREDGLVAPLALVAAMGVATGALMVEALLFRGVFDIAALLNLPAQRLGAAVGLLTFVALLLAVEIPMVLGALRLGRQLETRFRMALLRKLPRLNDRYFQSRPISDMADRNHNIQAIRNVPSMGLEFVQSIFELILTFAGILVIAPASGWMAAALVATAMALPLVLQPMLNERDLRVRNHAGALHGFYLDALLGLAPVRAHRAERNVQRQHESLLVEWARSSRGWVRMALLSDGVQSIVAACLAGALLVTHFLQAGRVAGSDLLLVYWALKLPAIGSRIAGLAHQYPAQRNVLLRLLEPLSAPDEPPTDARDGPGSDSLTWPPAPPLTRGVGLVIAGGGILAGGHAILRDIDLRIERGEHVAIVGVSGAGKSSLLGLLLGWHRLSSGTLTIDGAPAASRDVERLRQVTAWVDPGIQIWNRSFLENLEYASEGDAQERVGAVIDAARLRGVVQALPRGLQSLLGEGGGLLSGGEGQRVRLARALLASGSRLALLDEPFRGMDRTQRRALLEEARLWWRETTLICVTHDVGETLSFGRVLVVEDGRIVEDGPPQALAAGSSRYRALLDAEIRVGEQVWQDRQWRRLRVDDGRLTTATAQP